MTGVIKVPPAQRARLRPLGLLGELATHEQQLLARVRPHVPVERTQAGKLLPAVTGHLLEQGALPVHHLVMAERQDEVLRVGVHHGEGHLVMVVGTEHRCPRKVVQRVVHPAHIPFEAETQATEMGRPGDTGPGRRLLGNHDCARDTPVDRGVGLLEEGHGFQILPATVDIGHPAVGGPGVVEVEHGRDSVDPQPVYVEFLEPVHGVRDQEVAYLGPPEVEDVGSPVGLFAAPRIGMLVQRCAVEAAQRPDVAGEVRGNPVHDDADAGLVQLVDEMAEVVGITEARRRGIVGGHLVAPRAAEGMLSDREQLDVGEPQLPHVAHEFVGEFPVGQSLAPRPQVHLVD